MQFYTEKGSSICQAQMNKPNSLMNHPSLPKMSNQFLWMFKSNHELLFLVFPRVENQLFAAEFQKIQVLCIYKWMRSLNNILVETAHSARDLEKE